MLYGQDHSNRHGRNQNIRPAQNQTPAKIMKEVEVRKRNKDTDNFVTASMTEQNTQMN
jgi:hypothetical protein